MGSLKDAHALILQPEPDHTFKHLGVASWTRLGTPTFNDGNNAMEVKELFEARRINMQCRCGCVPLQVAPFDFYLDNPRHILRFRKDRIVLV